MVFFGKKKRKKKKEEDEGKEDKSKRVDVAKPKKKAAKSKRKPSVVSTKARGTGPRVGTLTRGTHAGSTLRRRGTARTRGAHQRQVRPHFIVDPTSKKLVQVNLPTPGPGPTRGYQEEQRVAAPPAQNVDKIRLNKTLLRHPAHGHRKPRARKKSWAEDPSDLDLDNMMSDVGLDDEHYDLAQARAAPHEVKITTPRSRTHADLQEWLAWRVKVNEQLTSFVIRDRQEFDGSMPVPAFPRTLKEDRLSAICEHAKTQEKPKTSLDNLSYMIYGLPRVSTNPPRHARTPSPDYEESGRYSTSDRSRLSIDTGGDTCDDLTSGMLTSSTDLYDVPEPQPRPSPPVIDHRGHRQGEVGVQRRQAVYRRRPPPGPQHASAPVVQYRTPIRRGTRGKYTQGVHRSPSPIYQNTQAMMSAAVNHRVHPPGAQRVHSPRKDTYSPSAQGRHSSQGCTAGPCSKPPIAGAVPTVLSLCSLQHGAHRELRHVTTSHDPRIPPMEHHMTRQRQPIGQHQSHGLGPPAAAYRDSMKGKLSAKEVYRHYRQQVPRK